MVVTGECIWQVQHKNQMCYLVRINKIDDGTIFHIVKKNLKINTSLAIPFESESPNPIEHMDPSSLQGKAVNPNQILHS